MDEYTRTHFEMLGLPLEPIPHGEVDARYRAALAEGRKQGFTPVVLQASAILAETFELFIDDGELPATPEGLAQGRAKILEEAAAIDVEAFFEERLEEYLDYMEGQEGEFVGEGGYSTLYAPEEELFLVKLPTDKPYEAAAFIPMGGFNDCPDPATQVAVFKYWYERYGACPAVVSYDTWQMVVERPPATDDDCYALARQHYAFSCDNLLQSDEARATLKGYAAAQRGSGCWFFWWD